MTRHRNSAYSTIEWLIVMTIIIILVTITSPAITHLVTTNKITTRVNQLVHTIHLAREAAIYRNQNIIICPTNNRFSCSGSWHDGIIVFTDSNNNKLPDAHEEVISVLSGYGDDAKLHWRAFRKKKYLMMTPRGFTAWQNGTFTYCHDDDLKNARGVILNQAGRIRLTTDADNDGYHEGANGKPLRCSE